MKHGFGSILLLLAFASPSLAATQVGVTSAVLPAARGTPPAKEARVLQVGLDMQASERVQTDADGKAQLLFVDGSALSIGPNSDLVLDEYVYDPEKQTGKIALSATRGVFRLVGGKISKNTPVTLTTPTATIGVRGGIAIVEVGQQVAAKFLFGRDMTVAAAGVTRLVERPGSEVITPPGAGPGEARVLSDASVAASMSAFENQNAPAPGSPSVSDDDVAASQVTSLNSTAGLSDAAPAAGGGAPAPGGDAAGGELRDASQGDGMQQALLGGAAEDESGEDDAGEPALSDSNPPPGPSAPIVPPVFPPAPTGVLPAPTTFTGLIRTSVAPTASFGTSSASNKTLASFTAFASPFTTTASGGGAFEINADAGTFAATSTMNPYGGGTLLGQGQNFANEFFFYELVDQSDMSRVIAFVGAATPAAAFPTTGATFYDVRRDFVIDSDVPFTLSGAGTNLTAQGGLLLPGPAAAILWDGSGANGQRAFGSAAIAIVGQGATQVSSASASAGKLLDDGSGRTFLTGFMRGSRLQSASGDSTVITSPVASADGGLGNDFFGQSTPRYFLAEAIQVDAMDALISVGAQEIEPVAVTNFYPNSLYVATAGALGARNSSQLMGYAAGYVRGFDSGGMFTFDGLFDTQGSPSGLMFTTVAAANKVYGTIEVDERFGTSPNLFLAFGDNAGAADGRSAFIDDQRFLAIESGTVGATWDGDAATARSYFTTSHALAAYGLLPAGVGFCACLYSRWGFWGGDATLSSSGDRAVSHLATWVAGPISNASDIAGLSGTATYNGHVIGTVQNGANVYTAVGSLQLNVDFTNQLVSGGAIGSFDGANYTIAAGSFGSSGGLNTFHAGISSGLIGGALDGSFVTGGGDFAAEAIGQAHAASGQGGYFWVGTFAGKR